LSASETWGGIAILTWAACHIERTIADFAALNPGYRAGRGRPQDLITADETAT
jgi:hypothetical protein